MKYLDFFSDKEIEINTKYFAIWLVTMFKDNKVRITTDELSHATGLSKGQIYRAQSNLKKLNILSIQDIYNQDSGKKESQVYSFIWGEIKTGENI